MTDPEPASTSSEDAYRLARRLHRIVGLDSPVYSREELIGELSSGDDRLTRWWRAMGFPENAEGVLTFSEYDRNFAHRLTDVTDVGIFSDDDIARMARLMGASFSRIAEAQIAMIDDALRMLPHAKDVRTPADRMKVLVETGDAELMEVLEESIVYVWKRHLLAAFGRWVAAEDPDTRQAVGFLDLVKFSRLSRELSAGELADLVDRFERVSFDTVSAHGGRVVKLIGDEVMFVAPTLELAVDIGLSLKQEFDGDELMPKIRCGLAFGPTVNVGGDVFGGTVNLASRLAETAKPSTVIAPREQVAAVVLGDDVVVKRVRRRVNLKGIGNTAVTALERHVAEPDEPEPEPFDTDTDTGPDSDADPASDSDASDPDPEDSGKA